mmetsp:Transcript_5020/g.12631  ORF Transcript_5020/g.12631 Transcript_5020/m.12631 type:complete len:774 (-) Transcript_5020:428-2749(-)
MSASCSSSAQARSPLQRPRTAPLRGRGAASSSTAASGTSNLERALSTLVVPARTLHIDGGDIFAAPAVGSKTAFQSTGGSGNRNPDHGQQRHGFVPPLPRKKKTATTLTHMRVQQSGSAAAACAAQSKSSLSMPSSSFKYTSSPSVSIVPRHGPRCDVLVDESSAGDNKVAAADDIDIPTLNAELDKKLTDARLSLRLDAERARTELLGQEMEAAQEALKRQLQLAHEQKLESVRRQWRARVELLEADLLSEQRGSAEVAKRNERLAAELGRLKTETEKREGDLHTEICRLKDAAEGEREEWETQVKKLQQELEDAKKQNVDKYQKDLAIMRRCCEKEYDEKATKLEQDLVDRFHRLLFEKEKQERKFLEERKTLETEKQKLWELVERLRGRFRDTVQIASDWGIADGMQEGQGQDVERHDEDRLQEHDAAGAPAAAPPVEDSGASCGPPRRVLVATMAKSKDEVDDAEREHYTAHPLCPSAAPEDPEQLHLVPAPQLHQDDVAVLGTRPGLKYQSGAPPPPPPAKEVEEQVVAAMDVEGSAPQVISEDVPDVTDSEVHEELLLRRSAYLECQDRADVDEQRRRQEEQQRKIDRARKRKYVVFEVAPSRSTTEREVLFHPPPKEQVKGKGENAVKEEEGEPAGPTEGRKDNEHKIQLRGEQREQKEKQAQQQQQPESDITDRISTSTWSTRRLAAAEPDERMKHHINEYRIPVISEVEVELREKIRIVVEQKDQVIACLKAELDRKHAELEAVTKAVTVTDLHLRGQQVELKQ